MSARRASIAQVMVLVALAALNLAFFRLLPADASVYPTVYIILGPIDFVVFWKLVVKRSLQAFQYTFLVVFLISSVVMMHNVAMERFQPLGFVVRRYQQLSGANAITVDRGFPWIGELWTACFLGFALACAIGWVAAWFEKRRDWDIAAFWRGALVGLGISAILATIGHAVWGGAEPSSVLLGERTIMMVCVIAGGRMGLSKLKSSRPGQEGKSSKVGVTP